MITNDLPIPESLLALIRVGRWPQTSHEALQWNRQSCIPIEIIHQLAPEESGLYLYPPPFGKPESSLYRWEECCGQTDNEVPPGDIDFTRAVIIGDFGLGSDAPIALDYRTSLDTPSVIRYRWSPYGKNNRWVYIASSFEEFAERLQL